MAMIPGIAHTIVEPGLFADMPYLVTLAFAAHLGVLPWPFGGGQDAPPSVEDIAAVVAGALMDPEPHAGRRYRPTGPELLDGAAMARRVGTALGRRVRLAPMPFWLFLRAARLRGFPIALLATLQHYAVDQTEGAFAVGAPTDHVRAVTGRAPESFESVARRHSARIERGFVPALKASASSMVLPFVPAPPIERYIRGLHLPEPKNPISATRSVVWRRAHEVEAGRSQPASALHAIA
jgi:NAD(P)H dehydrogenase (quinone)